MEDSIVVTEPSLNQTTWTKNGKKYNTALLHLLPHPNSIGFPGKEIVQSRAGIPDDHVRVT